MVTEDTATSCSSLLLLSYTDQQQLMEEHRGRTDQLIMDTSKREAELLLRNSELTQEVCTLTPVLQPTDLTSPESTDQCHAAVVMASKPELSS